MAATLDHHTPPAKKSLYAKIPLYVKIMVGMALGVGLGYAWNPFIVDILHGPPSLPSSPSAIWSSNSSASSPPPSSSSPSSTPS